VVGFNESEQFEMPNQSSNRSFYHSKWGVFQSLAILLVLVTFFERPASAYTDPGTTALLWQLLVGAGLGAMFYFRRFFGWITGKNKNRAPEKE
jgi:hypothetical protein